MLLDQIGYIIGWGVSFPCSCRNLRNTSQVQQIFPLGLEVCFPLFRMYEQGEITLEGLARKAPLIARAIEKQQEIS